MDFRAFIRDIESCARSPWLQSHRLRALHLLMIERWNAYSPRKWEPDLQIPISYRGDEWILPMRMWSEDYEAFRQIFLHRYYDHDLGQPEKILDLGGYCGYSAVAFSARFPDASIAAVEPHPENFARLARNVEMNRLRVRTFQAAATVADGPVRLFLGGGMTHGLSPTSYSTGQAIDVDGLSVPTILEKLGWDRVDLLKIDIEGSEQALFRARQPWLASVQTIIGEYHEPYGIPQLIADLEPCGFHVTALPHPYIFLAVRPKK